MIKSLELKVEITLSNVYDEQHAKEIITRGLDAVGVHLNKIGSETKIEKIEFDDK